MCPMLSLFNFTFVYCCHFITLHVSIAVTFHSFTRVHYSHFIALHVSTTVTLQLYICPLLSFCSFTSSFFFFFFFHLFFTAVTFAELQAFNKPQTQLKYIFIKHRFTFV